MEKAALLVIDVQLDFCPGGALPVPHGDAVVTVLNRYLSIFSSRGCPIFASRDWHPHDSSHFMGSGGKWPPHCVQGSEGADFHPQLALPEETMVISKGVSRWDDGYSAFQGFTDNGTPFKFLLQRLGIERLFVGGLATDYCVKETVLEALREGFGITLLADATRGVDLIPGDSERAVHDMLDRGAELADFQSVALKLTQLSEGG